MTRAKPAEVRRRDGNPGKRVVRDPVVPGGRRLPEPPPWLRPSQKAVYLDVRADLASGGILAHIDGGSLTRYAMAQGMVAEIGAYLTKRELIGELQAETVRGTARSPLITTLLALLTEARLAGQALGDNPSSRASLGMKDVETVDDIEAVLGPPVPLRVVRGSR